MPYKIKSICNKFQPVSYKPFNKKQPISDLFVWRNSPEWKTYFDLISIYSLFSSNLSLNSSSLCVNIIIFDNEGSKITEQKISINPLEKRVIDISDYLIGSESLFGTFAVFHQNIPDIFFAANSNLSERGYISYSFKNEKLRQYVHGNLDAVTIASDGNLKMLGGVSLFKREYKLQCLIKPDRKFSFALTNPSFLKQKVTFTLVNSVTKDVVQEKSFALNPIQCIFFEPKIKCSESLFLIIKSNLVMARPLIFSVDENEVNMDIFHG